MNEFSNVIMEHPYLQKLILNGMGRAKLQYSLMWLALVPCSEQKYEPLLKSLWINILTEARSAGILATDAEKEQIQAIIKAFGLENYLQI